MYFKGQYTDCHVFNGNVEQAAISQIYRFLNHPAFEGLKIRIMPDVHAGAGAVIGFTSTIGDKIIPNVIGVDIGCGVLSCCFRENISDFGAVDEVIRKNIPSGFSVRDRLPQRYIWDKCSIRKDFLADVERVSEETNQDSNRVKLSLGTLGGGNHFIEIGEEDGCNCRWLTVHTGSRNFGLKIANFHQKIAKEKNPNGDLSYLTGDDAAKYYEHMKIAQEFAAINRKIITTTIMHCLGWNMVTDVESVHNYIDFEGGFIRKGAISAKDGECVVIPWNMRDGLILAQGLGNEDWNSSAPHGAGRVMGRSEAKKTLNLEAFKDSMKDVWTSCVSADTIDESPFVYKDSVTVESLLGPTVTVAYRIKPLYNFKASERISL